MFLGEMKLSKQPHIENANIKKLIINKLFIGLVLLIVTLDNALETVHSGSFKT